MSKQGPRCARDDGGAATPLLTPGGTFGNRNFMAHLVAIGLPVLLYVAIESRSRTGFALGAAGLALAAAALVLSRSRAAWLSAGAGGLFLAIEGLWVGRLWTEERLRRRVLQLAAVALASSRWPWCCPTGSTGGRARPISSRSRAWPTTRRGADGGG